MQVLKNEDLDVVSGGFDIVNGENEKYFIGPESLRSIQSSSLDSFSSSDTQYRELFPAWTALMQYIKENPNLECLHIEDDHGDLKFSSGNCDRAATGWFALP